MEDFSEERGCDEEDEEMKDSKTLLELALSKTAQGRLVTVSEEEIEVLLAYVSGKVSCGQISKALNIPIAGVRNRLLTWFTLGCGKGLIRVLKRAK